MFIKKNDWALVYEKAIRSDGTLLFPERLTHDFLEKARKTMGSYLFANQYQNEIIPEGKQTFKKHWLKYYNILPPNLYTFAFVDPAIGEADTNDYTGFVVVSVDSEQNWYVRTAQRYRVNPSELIDACFRCHETYKTFAIGIEDVAFQRAIVHFSFEEMKRRGKHIPITGVKRGTDKTKEMRILSLVPRFEWGTLYLPQGCHDLEMELAQFPRGSHDDILDALSSLDSIIHYPAKLRGTNDPPNANDPSYESWYIKQLIRRQSQGE